MTQTEPLLNPLDAQLSVGQSLAEDGDLLEDDDQELVADVHLSVTMDLSDAWKLARQILDQLEVESDLRKDGAEMVEIELSGILQVWKQEDTD